MRHGESETNVQRRYIGDDVPLTALGVQQAEFVAERFTTIPFDIVLTSTMARAMQTGEAIAKKNNKPIEHLDLFRELNQSHEYMGLSFDDPRAVEARGVWRAHVNDPINQGTFYTENFFELKTRALEALELLATRPEETIIVATHGTFLKLCTSLIIAGDTFSPELFLKMEKNMITKNTGITICEYKEDKWLLHAWNDHAHLGEPTIKAPEVLA